MRSRAARRALALTGCLLAGGVLGQPAARADEPAGASPAIQLAKSYGPSFPAMEDPARDVTGAPTLVVQQGFGCLILGTAGTAAAMGASSLNVVQNIAGGLVAPANATVLGLGLVGVVFATYCSIGAAVTPLYLHLTGDPAAEPPQPPASQARTPPARRPDPAVHRASLGTTAFRSGVLDPDRQGTRRVPAR
jgi:hypothetical protein